MMAVFDLDGTLGTLRGGFAAALAPIIQRGYSLEQTRTIIRSLPVSEHSLERFAQEFDIEQARALEQELQESFWPALTLYDDARDVIRSLDQHRCPYRVVTCGNRSFQLMKLRHLGLSPSETIVTSRYNSKGMEIARIHLHHGTPLVFVDNKLEELDNVRSYCGALVRTIWIDRGEVPYAARGNHQRITDLREIIPLII